jgi:hypothetical protein
MESSNAQKIKQQVKMASNYIWPLSKSTTPDKMNTSFGPRINRNKWDFHDGIDLPAAEQQAFPWGVNNVQKTNALWLANKGEILNLPPQEQASMMQSFVSLGTNIVAQNPVVKAEMDKLQALVDAKRPK